MLEIKTKEFKEVCKNLLLAVSEQAANLELVTKDNTLYLNVTNAEYFVSIKFLLAEAAEFQAVVDAKLFLELVSGITTETFSLAIKDNTVVVKAGKSSYKLAMVYENDSLLKLPIIAVSEPTVEMTINNDILQSIVNINSKELLKVKNLKNVDMNELNKLYYVTEEGCFTFTTGGCLNKFTLEKPVQMLLNDRIVRLFKLFNEDVHFTFGHEQLANGSVQTRISFKTPTIYLGAIITGDDLLLDTVKRPYTNTKGFITAAYDYKLVLSVAQLSAAISRLMLFTKNSIDKVNMLSVPATFTIEANELTITDKQGNAEVLAIENDSLVAADTYTMVVNLADIKLILDTCVCDHITLNCGNHRSIVITRPNLYNLLPEGKIA